MNTETQKHRTLNMEHDALTPSNERGIKGVFRFVSTFNFKLSTLSSSRGFTLAEILVVVAILGMIVGLFGKFGGDIFSFSRYFSRSLDVAGDARKVLRPMINEVRGAAPSAVGSYPIETADTTTFTFYTDTDDNGVEERVRYYLSGTSLMKGIIVPTGNPYTYNSADEITATLINDVANGVTPIFTYYDSAYDGTTSALSQPVSIPDIRLVRVEVIIDKDSATPPGPLSIVTQVTLRNIKDNL